MLSLILLVGYSYKRNEVNATYGVSFSIKQWKLMVFRKSNGNETKKGCRGLTRRLRRGAFIRYKGLYAHWDFAIYKE